jgi:enamine deaminase RidA (YjgF/YER057c/UK114 family)
MVDLPRIALLSDLPRHTGKREKKDTQNQADLERSVKRSVQTFRYALKSKGADRMMTLSVSSSSVFASDRGLFLHAFSLLMRSIANNERRLVHHEWVFELQKNGSYHMHVAIAGFFNVVRANKVWRRLTGSPNGLDVSFRSHLSDFERRAGIAKYMSKYLSKAFAYVEFNKKRHGGSRHVLPERRVIVLKAMDRVGAVVEISAYLALDFEKVLKFAYFFEPDSDRSGFWLSYDDRLPFDVPF